MTYLLCYLLPLLSPSFNSEGDPKKTYDQGDSLYYQQQLNDAIVCYRLAASQFLTQEDTSWYLTSINDIGLCHYKLGRFDSALHFYKAALQIDEKRGDSSRWSGRLRNIGIVYQEMGNFALATRYVLQSKMISSMNRDIQNQSSANTLLGNIYLDQGKFEKALKEFKRSLQGYISLKDSVRIGIALNNIGTAYMKLNVFDSALVFFDRSLALKIMVDNESSQAFTYHNLGMTHARLGDLRQAESNLRKALEIRRSVDDLRNHAFTANELAGLYLKIDRPAEARNLLDQALAYAHKHGNSTILMDNLKIRSHYMKTKGELDSALYYFTMWSDMNDSTFNVQKLQVQELVSEYDLNRKEGELNAEEKRAEKERTRAADRLLVIWIIIGCMIALVVFVLVILSQRTKIKKLNSELFLLNRDMYHRKKNDYARVLDELDQTGLPTVDVVRRMLYASATLDAYLYEDANPQVRLDQYLEDIGKELSESLVLSKKGIILQMEIEPIILNGEKASKMAFILSEQVTNSAKHSFKDGADGTIKISIVEKEGAIKVRYEDNGLIFSAPDEDTGETGLGQNLMADFLRSLRSEITRERKEGWNISTFSIKK